MPLVHTALTYYKSLTNRLLKVLVILFHFEGRSVVFQSGHRENQKFFGEKMLT